MTCRVCRATSLVNLGAVGRRPRSVTSDSLLCDVALDVWCCEACAHIQKLPSGIDLAAIDAIYADYRPHHLSGGREQLVFPPGLPARTRSFHCLEQCASHLPSTGRLLDVGVGNGAFLHSAQKLLPAWKLHGFDVGDRHRAEVEAMAGVEAFWSGEFSDVPAQTFDLVVLWHTLEHVPDPVALLRQIASKLTPSGHILVQVPDVERNPFDLAVVDHASHFDSAHLRAVCSQAGLGIAIDGSAWVHNCLTVLAGISDEPTPAAFGDARWTVSWLRGSVDEFAHALDGSEFAIFGTGMAGLWLAGQFDRPPACFIDQDPERTGQLADGVPIVGPDDVDVSLPIVMSFIPETATRIVERAVAAHERLRGARFLVAPPLPRG